MANPEHLSVLKKGSDFWNNWRNQSFPPGMTAHEKSTRMRIDLTDADLSKVFLEGVNFFCANLNGVNLKDAYLLDAHLVCARLENANLEGIDLSSANVINASFNNSNLRNAKLLHAEALDVDFEGADLTGACIEDWNINSNTNFNNVICDYIYLKSGQQERRPSNPTKNFELGEFAALIQKSVETVDLIFSNGIDWQSFLQSFQDIQVEGADRELAIQAIERKTGGALVVRVEVPPDTDKAKIEESFWRKYRPILQAKDEQLALYGQILEDKRNENTQLLDIVETMAIKEDESLNEVQVKILQSIKEGISYDKELSEFFKLPIHEVRYYLEFLEKNNFFNEVIKGTDMLGDESFMLCTLSNKGLVAADNTNNLIKESTMSKEVNYNLQNSKFGGGFAAEGGTQLGGTFNDYSITIRQNIDDIERLIASLRENIQHFPDDQREDAEMELEDLEEEVRNPDKRNPKRFKKIIKGLLAAGGTATVLTNSAVDFSENLNKFTDNVTELGEKLEVSVDYIKAIL